MGGGGGGGGIWEQRRAGERLLLENLLSRRYIAQYCLMIKRAQEIARVNLCSCVGLSTNRIPQADRETYLSLKKCQQLNSFSEVSIGPEISE